MTASSKLVLLDTDVYSYLLNGHRLSVAYRRHIEGQYIVLSFVTIGELYFGAYRKNWGQNRMNALQNSIDSVIVIPYDQEICRTYAKIKATLEHQGKHIEDNDTWIAACAVRYSIPLISHNRSHFEWMPNLILISEA